MQPSLQHAPLIEYWTSQAEPLQLPPGQHNARRRWQADLMVMDQYNSVVEYAVTPKSKVTLSAMLDIIQQLMRDQTTDTTKDCGFRVW